MKKKVRVSAEQIVRDIRQGKSDDLLMKKFGLSHSMLEKTFGKLVERGLLTEMELYERSTLSDTAVTKVFLETQRAVQELADAPVAEVVDPVTNSDHVEITEAHAIDEQAIQNMLEDLKRGSHL